MRQAKTGFKTTSAAVSAGRGSWPSPSACISLTTGNLARHLERLSTGSAASAAAASPGLVDVRPKGFADLPASVEALILRDAFVAGDRTLRSWLNLSLVSKCGSWTAASVCSPTRHPDPTPGSESGFLPDPVRRFLS